MHFSPVIDPNGSEAFWTLLDNRAIELDNVSQAILRFRELCISEAGGGCLVEAVQIRAFA